MLFVAPSRSMNCSVQNRMPRWVSVSRMRSALGADRLAVSVFGVRDPHVF
jgi:hypothetical protein